MESVGGKEVNGSASTVDAVVVRAWVGVSVRVGQRRRMLVRRTMVRVDIWVSTRGK